MKTAIYTEDELIKKLTDSILEEVYLDDVYRIDKEFIEKYKDYPNFTYLDVLNEPNALKISRRLLL